MKRIQSIILYTSLALSSACGKEEPLVDPDNSKLGLNDACSSDSDCMRALECVDYAVYIFDDKKAQCLIEPTQKMYNTCQKKVMREYKSKEGCESVYMQKEVPGWQDLKSEANDLETKLLMRKQMEKFVDQIVEAEKLHFKKHEYYVAAKSYPPLTSGSEMQPWVVEDSGGYWKMNFVPLPGRAGDTPKKVRLPEQLSNFAIIGSYAVKLIKGGFVVEVRSDLDNDGETAVFRYNSVSGSKGWDSRSEL